MTAIIHARAALMKRMVAVIINAHDGVGFEAAHACARTGAKIIMGSPTGEKGEVARRKIIESTGNTNVLVKYIDLTNFNSVKAFAADILATEPQIHMLVNNPGAPIVENDVTCDGLTTELQVCHFAPFLLTMLLLPLLKASNPSRIINMALTLYSLGKFEAEVADQLSDVYVTYSQKITCLKIPTMMFTTKLSTLLVGTGVTVDCLDREQLNTGKYPIDDVLARIILKLFLDTPLQEEAIQQAASPQPAEVTGRNFRGCEESQQYDPALNTTDADLLWEMSNLVVFGQND